MDKVLEKTHYIQAVKLPNDHKKLEEIAGAAQGDITVWEGGFIIPLTYAFLGVGIIILSVQELMTGRAMTATIMTLIALFLFFLVLRWILRRQIPFFTLTREGLVCSVFKTVVPWRGIEDFQINAAKSNALNLLVGMEFQIIDRFLPELTDQPRTGSYYDEEKKRLMIAGNNFRLDTNRDQLIADINRYRNAALAQHKLQMKQYK